MHPQDSSVFLPSARELLRSSVQDSQNSYDKMVIDESIEDLEPSEIPPNGCQDRSSKPQLPSIKSMPAYSPLSRTLLTASDEHLRHRMSDMSVSSSTSPPPFRTLIRSPARSPEQHAAVPRTFSSFEPAYETAYGRQTSLLAMEYNRRPSADFILPLPTSSAATSRRGSITTVDSSRSPSPSQFAKPRGNLEISDRAEPSHPLYDPFQRRHSIATGEPGHHQPMYLPPAPPPPQPRLAPRLGVSSPPNHRAFHPRNPIHEGEHVNGPYSAPSSPPPSSPSAIHEPIPRHSHYAIRQLSGDHRQSSRHNQPYSLAQRRASILADESTRVLSRRASMPLVSTRNDSLVPMAPISQEDEPPQHPHDQQDQRSETMYSRSPELRVSHKLAERKRRKEMKELFDELRESLPVEKSLKTSKWEILSKAVEYITSLKRRDCVRENELNALRQEIAMLKRERGNSIQMQQ